MAWSDVWRIFFLCADFNSRVVKTETHKGRHNIITTLTKTTYVGDV